MNKEDAQKMAEMKWQEAKAHGLVDPELLAKWMYAEGAIDALRMLGREV